MRDNLEAVEAACTYLADSGKTITFTAVAEHTGLSRTTLYRNPQLRAVVEEHRADSHDRHTLTGIAAELAHLRAGLEAVAHRVRPRLDRLQRTQDGSVMPSTPPTASAQSPSAGSRSCLRRSG